MASTSSPSTSPQPVAPPSAPPVVDHALAVQASPDTNSAAPSEGGPAKLGSSRFRRDDDRVPAWLVSMILHSAALLVLALLSVPEGNSEGFVLKLRKAQVETEEGIPLEQLQLEDPMEVNQAQAAESPVQLNVEVADLVIPELQPPTAPTQRPPDTLVERVLAAEAAMQQRLTSRAAGGGGLEGRSKEGRQTYGATRGATPESENAVELALRWLADHQQRDGAWSFDLSRAPCDGRCNDGRKNPDQLPTPPTAATGLALLAFLGAGYTHEEGPYTKTVADGLYYLRGQMRPAQLGADLQMGSMYGHGIATLAVVEAASMTGDPELREMAIELVQFMLAARHPSSSWGYTPGAPGDITLTGWQLMALKGARRLEISMPTDVFSRIRGYVDSLSPDDGVHYGYRKPATAKTPTAIGATLKLYLGRPPEDPACQAGLDQLIAWGPQPTNVYHNYYATLALHHASDPRWPQWHPRVRDHLVATQAKTGHQRGSWHFPDHYGSVGGRLYTTAMAAMILEVYYRYMPLYDEPNAFPL